MWLKIAWEDYLDISLDSDSNWIVSAWCFPQKFSWGFCLHLRWLLCFFIYFCCCSLQIFLFPKWIPTIVLPRNSNVYHLSLRKEVKERMIHRLNSELGTAGAFWVHSRQSERSTDLGNDTREWEWRNRKRNFPILISNNRENEKKKELIKMSYDCN